MNDEQMKRDDSETLEPTQETTKDLPDSQDIKAVPAGIWEGKAPVGAITSPSETGKYKMVLRDYAAMLQIEGSLLTLDYDEKGSDDSPICKTVLCQATRMKMQNVHHENRLLGPLLRSKGRIPGLSGFADQREVDLIPMDTIVTGTEQHELTRNIPSSGTEVRFASKDDVENFSGRHDALYKIGYLYGTAVPISLILKHFGPGEHGWGDAHMLGVFGATGSGKTVMAGSIIAGFAARKEMGMLILDPQGQISGFELGKDRAKWSWKLDEAFRLAGRGPDVKVISMREQVALESPYLFTELLTRNDFFDDFGIMSSEKKNQVTRELSIELTEWLKENKNKTLGDMEFFTELVKHIIKLGSGFYREKEKKKENIYDAFFENPEILKRAMRKWEEIRSLFAKKYKICDLLDDVLIDKKIVILDIDADEDIKDLYCAEILTQIKKRAEMIYRIQQGQFWRGDEAGKYRNVKTNALIVIDEAHRFAPQATAENDDQKRMVKTLVDAIATTRKLGVGWFHITQSVARFNKDIFRQIQTKILGVGIGTGADDEHLESALNKEKDLIERYRTLPRPATTNIFPFAIVGELVALGNGSKALFISGFKNQKELMDINPNHFKYPNGAPVPPRKKPEELERSVNQLPSPKRQLPPPEGVIPF